MKGSPTPDQAYELRLLWKALKAPMPQPMPADPYQAAKAIGYLRDALAEGRTVQFSAPARSRRTELAPGEQERLDAKAEGKKHKPPRRTSPKKNARLSQARIQAWRRGRVAAADNLNQLKADFQRREAERKASSDAMVSDPRQGSADRTQKAASVSDSSTTDT